MIIKSKSNLREKSIKKEVDALRNLWCLKL